MKVAFLIATMSAGGAERVAATLCNEWSAQGHEVSLLTYQQKGQLVHYALRDEVAHHPLDLASDNHSLLGTFRASLRRIIRIRRVLRLLAPDVLVCFMTEINVTGILAAKSIGMPVVISERAHPGYQPMSLLHRLARRLTYPWANQLVVQTAEVADWYRRRMKLPSATVPNPAMPPAIVTPYGAVRGRKQLVSVGRLGDEKGFDLLIDAFARIAARHKEWDLKIFGEGSERQKLEERVARYGLVDRIELPGVVDDIPERLAGADLYVHAARYDGFPNAIIEALAAGLCVVATDAPGATAELLRNGRFGLLVAPSDPDDLAAKLDCVLGNAALRMDYARRASEAIADLNTRDIAARWITLLESVACVPPSRRIRS